MSTRTGGGEMKRVITLMFAFLFLTSITFIPSAAVVNNLTSDTDISSESLSTIAQIPLEGVRVAIYDEDNLTAPVYSFAENLTNHLDEITDLLTDAGHTVTHLTEQDILDHELMTAAYDVFVLVNNVPRPSITKYVREFWMGGGGLLTFNGALSWLWVEDIFYPDVSYDPRGLAWDYIPTDTLNVSVRHPTMMDYHINDTVSERTANWATTMTMYLDGSDYAQHITPLLTNFTGPLYVSAFAMDMNQQQGGRLVHLPGDGDQIPTAFESIIVDSVEWLKPRVMGRIAFDLSHTPRLAIDIWDTPLVTVYSSTDNFAQFRDLAVNHTYSFDKIYPSASGNLTANRLSDYDILVLIWPDVNLTAAEQSAVRTWTNNGGSLLVLGDRTGMTGGGPGYTHINELLQGFDMSLGTTDILTYISCTPGTHVSLESTTSLSMGYHNYLSVLGDATVLWRDGANPVVAAQEYGDGRAILSADINIFDSSQLGEESNKQFALSALNWLNSNDADVLVYDGFFAYYGACLKALNDLGISYQPTFSSAYISTHLNAANYSILIVNQPNNNFATSVLDTLYAFVDNGGKLLMSYYDMDTSSSHPLWSKLGVEYEATVSGTPTMYSWVESSPVFNTPHDLSAINFTSDYVFADDGDHVSVLAGATALAGATPTAEDDNAFIVETAGHQTVFASYLIDTLVGDNDDSTYQDSIELWQNLITYISTPPGGIPINLDPTTLAIIGIGVLALILIVVVVRRRKK
jgi:hypothetical protein